MSKGASGAGSSGGSSGAARAEVAPRDRPLAAFRVVSPNVITALQSGRRSAKCHKIGRNGPSPGLPLSLFVAMSSAGRITRADQAGRREPV
jgi:hypothetical protein